MTTVYCSKQSQHHGYDKIKYCIHSTYTDIRIRGLIFCIQLSTYYCSTSPSWARHKNAYRKRIHHTTTHENLKLHESDRLHSNPLVSVLSLSRSLIKTFFYVFTIGVQNDHFKTIPILNINVVIVDRLVSIRLPAGPRGHETRSDRGGFPALALHAVPGTARWRVPATSGRGRADDVPGVRGAHGV